MPETQTETEQQRELGRRHLRARASRRACAGLIDHVSVCLVMSPLSPTVKTVVPVNGGTLGFQAKER